MKQQETMASLKHERDFGVETGKFLMSMFRKPKDRKSSWTKDIDQASPLLKAANGRQLQPPPRASYRQVFNYQSSVNLLVYFLLSVHAVASDQVCTFITTRKYLCSMNLLGYSLSLCFYICHTNSATTPWTAKAPA